MRPGAENVFMIIMNNVTLGKGIDFMHFIVEHLLTNSTNLSFIVFLTVLEVIKLIGGVLPFPDTRNIFKLFYLFGEYQYPEA